MNLNPPCSDPGGLGRERFQRLELARQRHVLFPGEQNHRVRRLARTLRDSGGNMACEGRELGRTGAAAGQASAAVARPTDPAPSTCICGARGCLHRVPHIGNEYSSLTSRKSAPILA